MPLEFTSPTEEPDDWTSALPETEAAVPEPVQDDWQTVDGSFSSKYDLLNKSFQAKFGRSLRTTTRPGDPGLKNIHKKLYDSDAADIGGDVSDEEAKWLVNEGAMYGIRINDYRKNWRQIGGSGPHLHVDGRPAKEPEIDPEDWVVGDIGAEVKALTKPVRPAGRVATPSDPNPKGQFRFRPQLEDEFNAAQKAGDQVKMAEIGQKLQQNGYEAGPGDGGWWYFKRPDEFNRARPSSLFGNPGRDFQNVLNQSKVGLQAGVKPFQAISKRDLGAAKPGLKGKSTRAIDLVSQAFTESEGDTYGNLARTIGMADDVHTGIVKNQERAALAQKLNELTSAPEYRKGLREASPERKVELAMQIASLRPITDTEREDLEVGTSPFYKVASNLAPGLLLADLLSAGKAGEALDPHISNAAYSAAEVIASTLQGANVVESKLNPLYGLLNTITRGGLDRTVGSYVTDLAGNASDEARQKMNLYGAQGFLGDVGRAGGSSVPFLVASMAGGSPVFAGLLGAGATTGQIYQEAKDSGMTDSNARYVSLLGIPTGFTEMWGIGRAGAGWGRGTLIKQFVYDVLREAGEEATQESVQQILTNLTAKGFYDPNREVFEGVGYAGIIAAITGGLFGAGHHVAGGTLQQAADLLADRRLRQKDDAIIQQYENRQHELSPDEYVDYEAAWMRNFMREQYGLNNINLQQAPERPQLRDEYPVSPGLYSSIELPPEPAAPLGEDRQLAPAPPEIEAAQPVGPFIASEDGTVQQVPTTTPNPLIDAVGQGSDVASDYVAKTQSLLPEQTTPEGLPPVVWDNRTAEPLQVLGMSGTSYRVMNSQGRTYIVSPNNVYVPPIVNTAEQVTPAEILSQEIAQPAPVETAPVSIPEHTETLNAQLDAVKQGRKPAMLVTEGEQMPKVPKGLKATKTGVGTFIHDPKIITPEEIIEAAVSDQYHELLGYAVPRPLEGEPSVVVAAVDESGRELQTAVVSPEAVEEQKRIFQEIYPDSKILEGDEALGETVLGQRVEETQGEIVSESAPRVQGVEGIVSRANQERRVTENKAFTDEQTGLANRNAFEAAKPRIDADPNQSWIMTDIDRLKYVNDNFDHSAGDAYIGAVSRIIREELEREGISERQAFRSGGDEFPIAVPTGKEAAIASRIQQRVAQEAVLPDGSYGSVSVGTGTDFALADEAAKQDKIARRMTREETAVSMEGNVQPTEVSSEELATEPSSDIQQEDIRTSMADDVASDPHAIKYASVLTENEVIGLRVYRGGEARTGHVYITTDERTAASHGKVTIYNLKSGAIIYPDPEIEGFADEDLTGRESLLGSKEKGLRPVDAGSAVVHIDDLTPVSKILSPREVGGAIRRELHEKYGENLSVSDLMNDLPAIHKEMLNRHLNANGQLEAFRTMGFEFKDPIQMVGTIRGIQSEMGGMPRADLKYSEKGKTIDYRVLGRFPGGEKVLIMTPEGLVRIIQSPYGETGNKRVKGGATRQQLGAIPAIRWQELGMLSDIFPTKAEIHRVNPAVDDVLDLTDEELAEHFPEVLKNIEKANEGIGELASISFMRNASQHEDLAEPEFVQRSRQRLKDLLSSGLRMDFGYTTARWLFDTAVVTGWDIYKFTKEKTEWASRLIEKLGDSIKPHVNDVWDTLMGKPDMFFSPLERALKLDIQATSMPDQLKATLRKAGVSDDEMKWTGFDEFLRQKALKEVKVTRQEALDFFQKNKVQLTETLFEDPDTRKYTSIPDFIKISKLKDIHEDVNYTSSVKPDDWVVYDKRDNEIVHFFNEGMSRDEVELYTIDWLNRQERESKSKGTKFTSYTTPGGINHREVTLTLPDNTTPETVIGSFEDQVPFKDTYYPPQSHRYGLDESDKNRIVLLRVNDRTGINGEKILHVDEFQDDLQNEIQSKKNQIKEIQDFIGNKTHAELITERGRLYKEYDRVPGDSIEAERNRNKVARELEVLDNQIFKAAELIQHQEGLDRLQSLLPFRGKSHELGMKYALGYAIAHGYDTLTWSTGRAVADRYSLTQYIQSLEWKRNADGTYNFKGFYNGQQNVTLNDSSLDTLPKEISGKIKDTNSRTGKLDIEELGIGGEGKLHLYDKMIPSFLKTYTKKWGGEVNKTEIQTNAGWSSGEVAMEHAGIPEDQQDSYWRGLSEEEREVLMDNHRRDAQFVTANSLVITPQMRESILRSGQSMFGSQEGSPSEVVDALQRTREHEVRMRRNPGLMELESKSIPAQDDLVEEIRQSSPEAQKLVEDSERSIGEKMTANAVKRASRAGRTVRQLMGFGTAVVDYRQGSNRLYVNDTAEALLIRLRTEAAGEEKDAVDGLTIPTKNLIKLAQTAKMLSEMSGIPQLSDIMGAFERAFTSSLNLKRPLVIVVAVEPSASVPGTLKTAKHEEVHRTEFEIQQQFKGLTPTIGGLKRLPHFKTLTQSVQSFGYSNDPLIVAMEAIARISTGDTRELNLTEEEQLDFLTGYYTLMERTYGDGVIDQYNHITNAARKVRENVKRIRQSQKSSKRNESTTQTAPSMESGGTRGSPQGITQAAKEVQDSYSALESKISNGTLGRNPVEDTYHVAVVTGYETYEPQMDKAQWSENLITHLGERARPHLNAVWDLVSGKPPTFYSPMENTLRRSLPEKASVEQIRGILRSNGLLSKENKPSDELKWSGLEEFMEGKQTLAKQEILDFLATNNLQVKTITSGQGIPPLEWTEAGHLTFRATDGEGYKYDIKAIHPAGWSLTITKPDGRTESTDDFPNLESAKGHVEGIRADKGDDPFSIAANEIRQLDEAGYKIEQGVFDVSAVIIKDKKTGDIIDSDDLSVNLQEAYYRIEDIFNEYGGGSTRFSEYKLDGGKNYVEIKIQSPLKKISPTTAVYAEGPNGFHIRQEMSTEEAKAFAAKYQNDNDYQIRLEPLGIVDNSQTFQSSHWGEPNIIAHIRGDERAHIDGVDGFVIDETQSDWHSEGRKHGYKKKVNVESGYGLWIKSGEYAGQFVDDEGVRMQFSSEEDAQDIADEMNGDEPNSIEVRPLAQAGRVEDGMLQRDSPPEAPFQKSWPLLTVKQAIKHAVDRGLSRISLLGARVHIDRWGTEDFHWSKPENSYNPDEFVVSFSTTDGGNKNDYQLIQSKDELNNYISSIFAYGNSQNLTDRFWIKMQQEKEGRIWPRAEGQLAHYGDTEEYIKQRFPNRPDLLKFAWDRSDGKQSEAFMPIAMRDVGKKWKTETFLTKVDSTKEGWSDESKIERDEDGDYAAFFKDDRGNWIQSNDWGTLQEAEDEIGASPSNYPVYSLNIPPSMSNAVRKSGQPLFGTSLDEPSYVLDAKARMAPNAKKNIIDQGIVTGYTVFQKNQDFDSWSNSMVRQLGQIIKPHLESIYLRLKQAAEIEFTNKVEEILSEEIESKNKDEKRLDKAKKLEKLFRSTDGYQLKSTQWSKVFAEEDRLTALALAEELMSSEVGEIESRSNRTPPDPSALFDEIVPPDSTNDPVYPPPPRRRRHSPAAAYFEQEGEEPLPPPTLKEQLAVFKTKQGFAAGFNFLRAWMTASIPDFSFTFRQGAALAFNPSNPINNLIKPFLAQVKSYGRKGDVHQQYMDAIRNDPDFERLQEMGVEFTIAGTHDEELFRSGIADRIPHVRWAKQASEAFMNWQKLLAGKDMLRELENGVSWIPYVGQRLPFFKTKGVSYEDDPKPFHDMAKALNALTARGNIKDSINWLNEFFTGKSLGDEGVEAISDLANTVMFSARRQKAIFDLLNPFFYARMDRPAAILASRKMFEFTGTMMSFLTIAAMLGAKVTLNPDDSDFGKIVIGNTHYDITAGFASYIRMFILSARKLHAMDATIIGQLMKNPKDILKDPMNLQGLYSSITKASYDDLVNQWAKFFRSKLAPWPSVVVDLKMNKTDFKGDPVTLFPEGMTAEDWKKSEVVRLFTPMMVSNLIQGWADSGLSGALKAYTETFGISTQTYPPRNPEERSEIEQDIVQANRNRYIDEILTVEDKEQITREREIVNLMKGGNLDDALEKFDKAIDEGYLAPGDEDRIIKKADMSYLGYNVDLMPLEKALDIFLSPKCTPEERQRISPLIERKYEAYEKQREDERQAGKVKMSTKEMDRVETKLKKAIEMGIEKMIDDQLEIQEQKSKAKAASQ